VTGQTSMTFLAALVVDGLLSGAVYGLIAMALVVTHKASRAINFALGEWMTIGAILVAGTASALPFGDTAIGFVIALATGVLGMQLLATVFARGALAPVSGRTAVAAIMLTLGLGIFLRGASDLVLAGVPRRLPLPFGDTALTVAELHVPGGKLLAAAIGLAGLLLIGWFYKRSRTGLALRAMAEDPRVAEAMGIDSRRYLALAWGLAAALAVITGVLWMNLTSGGFSLALLGLKILPILMLGGVDSVGGTLLAAMLVGVLESVTSGYLDPVLGSGLGGLVPNVLLLLLIMIRPTGFLGEQRIERI
jgi:branched-chain amino acid transport system permease protein